ncbi:hypothetical protein [Nubsella zeaxanthinifaciens]|uniref:hypothetical protein n=1 Tax=Nubsella zeaxanthinifaciens TaxID=392412 RepID=UPI0013009877|nr:hypothetical protein [Nubsella zeaxanthinifaciens]
MAAENKVWTCIMTTTPNGKTTESSVKDISIINQYPNAKITLETLNGKAYLLIKVSKP